MVGLAGLMAVPSGQVKGYVAELLPRYVAETMKKLEEKEVFRLKEEEIQYE